MDPRKLLLIVLLTMICISPVHGASSGSSDFSLSVADDLALKPGTSVPVRLRVSGPETPVTVSLKPGDQRMRAMPGQQTVTPSPEGRWVLFMVTVPDKLTSGDYTFDARIKRDGETISETTVTASVPRKTTGNITLDSERQFLQPGGQRRYTVSIRNRGNVPLQYNLDYTPKEAGQSTEIELSSKSGTVPAFSRKEETLTVTIPEGWPFSSIKNGAFSFRSTLKGDDTVVDENERTYSFQIYPRQRHLMEPLSSTLDHEVSIETEQFDDQAVESRAMITSSGLVEDEVLLEFEAEKDISGKDQRSDPTLFRLSHPNWHVGRGEFFKDLLSSRSIGEQAGIMNDRTELNVFDFDSRLDDEQTRGVDFSHQFSSHATEYEVNANALDWGGSSYGQRFYGDLRYAGRYFDLQLNHTQWLGQASGRREDPGLTGGELSTTYKLPGGSYDLTYRQTPSYLQEGTSEYRTATVSGQQDAGPLGSINLSAQHRNDQGDWTDPDSTGGRETTAFVRQTLPLVANINLINRGAYEQTSNDPDDADETDQSGGDFEQWIARSMVEYGFNRNALGMAMNGTINAGYDYEQSRDNTVVESTGGGFYTAKLDAKRPLGRTLQGNWLAQGSYEREKELNLRTSTTSRSFQRLTADVQYSHGSWPLTGSIGYENHIPDSGKENPSLIGEIGYERTGAQHDLSANLRSDYDPEEDSTSLFTDYSYAYRPYSDQELRLSTSLDWESKQDEGVDYRAEAQYTYNFSTPVPWHDVRGGYKGRVYIDRQNNGSYDLVEDDPIEGARLTVDGVSIVTDEDGRFQFKGLEPGKYDVEYTLPDRYNNTLTTDELKTSITVQKGEYTRGSLGVSPYGRIQAKLKYKPDQRAVRLGMRQTSQGFYIKLDGPEETRYRELRDGSHTTWYLPEGTYTASIYEDSLKDKQVVEPKKKTITVKSGERYSVEFAVRDEGLFEDLDVKTFD